jgi:hypothetical protein
MFRAMALVIREIHSSPGTLNDEWFIVENSGEKSFSTMGVTLSIGKGGTRPRGVGAMEPGFTLGHGEKVRVVTGNPGKKAHGKPPEDGVKNYHLFLAEPLLKGAGSVLILTLKQHELTRATFDPASPAGVGKAAQP